MSETCREYLLRHVQEKDLPSAGLTRQELFYYNQASVSYLVNYPTIRFPVSKDILITLTNEWGRTNNCEKELDEDAKESK